MFKFNFQEVYWCSKLSTERTNMLKKFIPGEIVCDMFAGVGPLSIRAAKMGCRVIANDLNPACYKYLIQNAQINKVSNRIHAYNLDAREFMRDLLKTPRAALQVPDLLTSPPFEVLPACFSKAYMNLPMDALEFLDVFIGNFDPEIWTLETLPTIFVYTFAPDEGYHELIMKRLHSVLGDFEDSIITIRHVRSVSPHKEMYCVEFQLPGHIAFCDFISKKLRSE